MSSPHGHGHPLPHAYSRPTATGNTFAIVDANNTPINVVHEPVDSSPGPESDALLSYPSAFASGDNNDNNDCNDDHNLGIHDDELQAHDHELEDTDSSVHALATSASSAIGAIGGHDDPPLTAPLTGVNIPPMSDSGPVPILALHPRLPRLDRSASMPAEAHLGHLRPPPLHPRHSHPRLHTHSTSHSHSHHHHPHRHTYSHTYFAEPTPLTSASSSAPVPGPEHAHAPYDEVSRELADTVQAIVQTLLHLSPPHILHPVKELFSACTVQLPTPSVSALLTTMKNLNYLSANLRGLAPAPGEAGSSPSSSPIATTTIGVPTASATSASIANQGENVFAEAQPVSPTAATGGVSDNFDVGEVVQSVGDVLGGLAAQAGVDLAIFHGDVGMRHINVIGDEQSILFILTHITRQILSCARPGDSIEIGLHLTSLLHHNSTLADPSSSPSVSSSPLAQPSSVDPLVTAPGEFISPILIEVGTPILTTFEITHRWKGSGTTAGHVPPPEPSSSLDTEGTDTGLEAVASTTASTETGTAADLTQMHGQPQQQHRESPRLDSILIKRLLSKTGTTLDIRPSGNASSSSPRTSPAVPKAGSAAARIPSTMTMGDTTYLLSTRLVRGPAPARLAAPPSLTLLDDDESLVLSHSAAHSHSHSHTQSLPASVSPSPLPGQTAPHPPLLPFSLPMHAPLPKGALELAQEPNMEDLAIFSEVELRGKRAVLHAAEDSTFARHLTSYLTSWGLDVGHVPINAGPHLTRRGGAGGTETDGGTTGAGSALGTDDASSGAAALGSGDPSNTGLGPEEMSLLSVQIQIDPTTGAMLSPPTSETHSGMDGGGSTGHTPNTSDGSIAGGVGSGGGGPSMTSTSASSSVGHPAFIIIDDDVDVLRRILNRYRPEVPHVTPSPLKRPSLALNHRPRSSPQIRSVLGISTPNEKRSRAPTHQPGTTSTSPSGGTAGAGAEPLTPNPNVSATPGASAINGATDAGTNGPQAQLSSQSPHIHVYTPPHQDSIIVHITSLAHYKAVKDTIQSALFLVPPSRVPDIMVVPKPAGPRRFLTALYTAVKKPLVDPYFAPIATSPQSPGGVGPTASFLSMHMQQPQPSPLGAGSVTGATVGGRRGMTGRKGSTGSAAGSARGGGGGGSSPGTTSPSAVRGGAGVGGGSSQSTLSPSGASGSPGDWAATLPLPTTSSSVAGASSLSSPIRERTLPIGIGMGIGTSVGTPSAASSISTSASEHGGTPQPSPLAAESLGYFGAHQQQGYGSGQHPNLPFRGDAMVPGGVGMVKTASSGVMIKSPDGKPTGIYFQPPQRGGTLSLRHTDSTSSAGSSGSGGASGAVPISVARDTMPRSSTRPYPPGGLTTFSRASSSSSRFDDALVSPGGSNSPTANTRSSTSPGFGRERRHSSDRDGTSLARSRPRSSLPYEDENVTPTMGSFPRPPTAGARARTGSSRSRPTSAGSARDRERDEASGTPGRQSSLRRLSSASILGGGNSPSPKSATTPADELNSPTTLPSSPAAQSTPSPSLAATPPVVSPIVTTSVAGGSGSPMSSIDAVISSVTSSALPSITSPVPRSAVSLPTPTATSSQTPPPAGLTTSMEPPLSASAAVAPKSPLNKLVAGVKKDTSSSTSTGGTAGAKTGKTSTGITPPISVLIVEDNPINQTIMSTFMRRRKLKYATANNGQEAVEKWQTGQYHLILMDIQMPVMDGIQATKEIRRLEKSYATLSTGGASSVDSQGDGSTAPSSTSAAPSTPFHSSVIIVALTASNLEADRVKALAAGCNDFLTKPVSLPWLDKKIIEWGSIKALQMWATPELTRDIQVGQEARAKALNLQLPPHVAKAAPAAAGGVNRSGAATPTPAPPASVETGPSAETTPETAEITARPEPPVFKDEDKL